MSQQETRPAQENGRATATFAGGCFWCVEAVFELVHGVETVESGYSGGHVREPSYEEVCTGTTGHAEAVRIVFYPNIISYKELLEIFFSLHDPTTPNRQGPDVGPQYRSAIFYHDAEQNQAAEEIIAELSAQQQWSRPIVTEVIPATVFYPAEEYHQEYYRRNSYQPYCQMVIAPKVAKFRQHHGERAVH